MLFTVPMLYSKLNLHPTGFSVAVNVSQHLVLAEEEWQQHKHASIMDDPPDINVTLSEALSVRWEGRDVLRDKQCKVSRSGFSDELCRIDGYGKG